MEHPNKEFRERQAKMLEQLPENLREEHARNFRLGNAVYIYHSLANKELEPTEEDFEEWLEGLPKNIGTDMRAKGFEECKSVLSFNRHVMEKNDIGMDEWMKRNLSKEDYRIYSERGEKAKSNSPNQ